MLVGMRKTSDTPTAPVVVKTTSYDELVPLIPGVLGFRPENSIVALPMIRKRSTFGARMLLSDASHSPKGAARAILGGIMRVLKPEAIILAVFTDDALEFTPSEADVPLIDTQRTPLPHQAIIDAFRDEAARRNIPTTVSVYIGPDGCCEYAPVTAEQTETNTWVEYCSHEKTKQHAEMVGHEIQRDPRSGRAESDQKTREIMQRLLHERKKNRLANAETGDRHEQPVDPHSHTA